MTLFPMEEDKRDKNTKKFAMISETDRRTDISRPAKVKLNAKNTEFEKLFHYANVMKPFFS